ncbi:hypothetical protein ES705_13986 [subsurface metagenome]
MDLSGKLVSITMVMDGRGTKIFEIEINKKRYKFEEQLRFYELSDLGSLQGRPIKLKGILNEDPNIISNVSDVWVKLF